MLNNARFSRKLDIVVMVWRNKLILRLKLKFVEIWSGFFVGHPFTYNFPLLPNWNIAQLLGTVVLQCL